MTDNFMSYDVTHRDLIPDAIHDKTQHANYRAERSHQAARVMEGRCVGLNR